MFIYSFNFTGAIDEIQLTLLHRWFCTETWNWCRCQASLGVLTCRSKCHSRTVSILRRVRHRLQHSDTSSMILRKQPSGAVQEARHLCKHVPWGSLAHWSSRAERIRECRPKSSERGVYWDYVLCNLRRDSCDIPTRLFACSQ